MIGLDFGEIFARFDDHHKFQQEIEQNGFVENYEVTFHRKDGTEMDCLLTLAVHRSHNGSPCGEGGIIRNVAVSKRTEEELQRSKSQLLFRRLVN